MKFAEGDILLSGPPYKPQVFVVTKLQPTRPKNCYDAVDPTSGKTFKLGEDSMTKIGTADNGWMEPGDDKRFDETSRAYQEGKRRAETEARYSPAGSDEQRRWEVLAKLKPGDHFEIYRAGRMTQTAQFLYVLAKGQKYAFAALTGTTGHKFQLYAVATQSAAAV